MPTQFLVIMLLFALSPRSPATCTSTTTATRAGGYCMQGSMHRSARSHAEPRGYVCNNMGQPEPESSVPDCQAHYALIVPKSLKGRIQHGRSLAHCTWDDVYVKTNQLPG